MFSTVKELLNFVDITGTSYKQLQAVNIAYIILHRTGKFGLAICEWNRMPELQKTWVRYKQFFRTSHREMREKFDLAVEEVGVHHANMMRNVVAGLQ